MTSHEKIWSSATPGLLIILIDQSGSMLAPYDGNDTKTVFASKAVNRVIETVIQQNFGRESPKNRCFISVIGYGNDAKELCSGYLKDLDANLIRIESIKKKTSDGAGGIIEFPYEMPIWVEPISSAYKDECSNMTKAFESALNTCEQWISQHPDTPAPVILNISCGMPQYEGKSIETCMAETLEVVNQLKATKCFDGNVLIYNALMDDNDSNISFPQSVEQCSNNVEQFIFDISSEVPHSRQLIAQKEDAAIKKNSRACVFYIQSIHSLVSIIQQKQIFLAATVDDTKSANTRTVIKTINNDTILSRIRKSLKTIFTK